MAACSVGDRAESAAFSRRPPNRLPVTDTVEAPDIEVPADEEPAATCPYCDRPFRAERHRILHVGIDHDDVWTDDERKRYEEEFDEESHELFTTHVLLVIGVVLGYFFFSYMYMIVWS